MRDRLYRGRAEIAGHARGGRSELNAASGEVLFEIIKRRYETRSTMMTSNRPLEDWGKLIGDVPSATAILDRFMHHAEIIAITGKSYRLRHQKTPVEAIIEDRKPASAPTGSGGKKKGKRAEEIVSAACES